MEKLRRPRPPSSLGRQTIVQAIFAMLLWFHIGPEPVRFFLIEFEHLTGLNYECIKNLDNPAVEVTDELARFWELMAVDIDAGPSSQQIVTACERCGE